MPAPRPSSFLAAVLAASAVSAVIADQIESVWTPGVSGNWNVPEFWDPFGVPDNNAQDFYIVRIDDDADADVSVTLNVNVTINGLTIDGGDRLRIVNGFATGRLFTVFGGPIGNSGVLELFSDNDFATQLRIDGDVTLNGTGAVEGVGNFRNVITTSSPGSRLTNLTNPITGVMQIGQDALSFTSHALVEANVDSRRIILDPPADGDITNAFMMRSSNGGMLELRAGLYENGTGTFAALDGSQILVQDGVVIDGGVLATEPAGEIIVRGGVRVMDIGNDGRLTIQNSRQLFVEGPLSNTGQVDVQASNAFPGRLTIDGDVSLTGGGMVTLTGSNLSGSVIDAVTEGDRLFNVDNTVSGRGLVGNDVMSLTNESLILANRDGLVLAIDPPASGDVTNPGTLRATTGATLRLGDGTYDNTGGLIEAQEASTIEVLTDVVLTGGTVRTTDTGGVTIIADAARFVDVAHDATTSIPNNRRLIVEGSLPNTGVLALSSVDVFPTRLTIDGDVTFTGGGTISMTSDIQNTNTCRLDAFTSGDRLTVMDGTIEGNGNIGGDSLSVTNHGRVDANHPSLPMTIDPPDAGDFTNFGMLVASGPADLNIAAGPIEQAGTAIIAAGARLRRLAGNYVQTAGATHVRGELEVDAGVVDLSGGALDGTGVVDGDVVVGLATFAPGESAGTLDVEGDFLPTLDGTLDIEIGGLTPDTEHDVLIVTGDAVLDGTLRLSLIDDFEPTIGDSFEILLAGGVVGEFPCVDAPVLTDGVFVVAYDVDRVTVSVAASGPSPADLDNDGIVGFGDLVILLGGWGPCPTNCCVADLDGSGDVDFADILVLLGAWG